MVDRKLRLRRGVEQHNSKFNPRFRLKGEEEKTSMQEPVVLTRTVEISGNETAGYRINKYTRTMPGDTVGFSNTTAGKVSIQFPVHEIFGQGSLELEAAGVPGSDKSLTVMADAAIGNYSYSAFCHKGGKFAVGGSMPIIIINPKDDR